MTKYFVLLERVSKLVDDFLYSFGRAWVALYVFPDLEFHHDFARFLNSFMSALKRADCRPVYTWSYDSDHGCFKLLLIINGYFRNDMSDITDVAQRIWRLYSPLPVQFIADMPLRAESQETDKNNLFEIINNRHFLNDAPQRLLDFHQRSFACSKLF